MPFLTKKQLKALQLAHYGTNCLISDKASFYNPSKIVLGDHVRIDDFCVLSAGRDGIELGSFIHIAIYSSLMGQAKITLKDYSGLSSRVAVYSSSDDFSGLALTNPMVDPMYTNVLSAPVTLEKHTLVGAGSVVLPGTHLDQAAVIGALSLAKGYYAPFTISGGVPAKLLKKRKKDLLQKEIDHAASQKKASRS